MCHIIEIITAIKKKLNNPKFLKGSIIITSLIAIVFSFIHYKISEKIDNSNFNAFAEMSIRDRFTSKHDLLVNTFEAREQLGLLRQAYQMYLAMIGSSLPNIDTVNTFLEEQIKSYHDYESKVDFSQLDRTNKFVVKNFNEAKSRETWKNRLFWWLITTQILNATFAALLNLDRN